MFVALLIPVVVVAVVLARAYGEVDDEFLAEWSAAHGLTLTPRNRPMVRWYLRNARVLRTWGALAGIFVPPLVVFTFGLRARVPQDWTWVFVGYLVGALYAELSLVRPVDPARRSASLVPRELESYLPRKLLRAQRALGVSAVVGAFLVAFLPYDFNDTGGWPNRTFVLVIGVATAAFAVALERLQRWLVRRPQPFSDPELLVADDAIRAQSAHSLAGSGLAVLLLLNGGICWALAVSDVQILRWTMWIPGVFSFFAALYACLYYGHRAWRVRRPVAGSLGVSAP